MFLTARRILKESLFVDFLYALITWYVGVIVVPKFDNAGNCSATLSYKSSRGFGQGICVKVV